MPVAYSYVRFSSPVQLHGDSLRRQLEASRRYAAEHNLTLDETLNVHDLGVSAFTGTNVERGALGKFIAAIDEGRVAPNSYLLVESLDRLSRLPVPDALQIFQAIINRGITIVTLTDLALYNKERLKNDWTPLIMALVSMSRAHEESAVKSRRITEAWKQKKERVKSNKEVMSGRCPWWLKPSADSSKYEINEDKADTVRLMFQLAKDGLGNVSIAKYLNEREIPTAQHAKYWQNSTVGFNLQNIAVIGVLQLDQDNNGRTTTNTFVEDYYPPIIDKELFYEVQALRASRRRDAKTVNAGRKGQCYNIFQGTARCGYCGGPVHIRRKPGYNTGFLYCAKSLQGGGCIGVSYNVRNLEQELLSFTKELNIAKVLGESPKADGLTAKQSELTACTGKLEDLERRMNNLASALETGGDVLFLVERLRNAESEVNELKKRRLELQTEIATYKNVSHNDQSFVENIAKLLGQLESKDTDLDDKLRLRFRLLTEVQKVFRRIDLYPGGLINTSEQLEQIAADLKDEGADPERVASYLSKMPMKPDRAARFFVAHLHNGIKRSVVNGKMLETRNQPAIRDKIKAVKHLAKIQNASNAEQEA
ncbi:recombinase family protein [Ralstonia sp. RL]|uniref:recombinase family protein n=1 Tax=Ralstonia sp. RL TaxID=1839756 RepID=UPI000A78E3C3|nr:recombinase family protein [Ralstonia sp. RL]